MEKVLILIVAIGILGGINCLQCYRCSNCTEVKSDQLVTCGSNNTVTTTTTTTTQKPNTTTLAPNTTVTVPSNGTATANSTANITQENPEALRVRRSAEEDEDNCFCDDNGDCNCYGLRIIQFGDEKASVSYVCVKDTTQVNGATVINRGCAVKHNQTQETCVSSLYSSSCTVCETDKCNDAASINFSILVLVTSFFAVIKMN